MVTADLAQRNSARTIAMGFLDTAARGGGLTSGLGGKMLTGRLPPCALSGRQLGACHCNFALQCRGGIEGGSYQVSGSENESGR